MTSAQCPIGDFGPAPAGIDLCANKNDAIIGPVVTVMIVSIAAVIVRLGCRYSISRKSPAGFLAVDDYLVIAALFMAICTAVCCLLGVHFGGGQHLWALSADKFNSLWKTLFAFVLIYVAVVTLTKTSIMLFYYRLFGTGVMWWIVISLIAGYFIAITVTGLVACRPLSYFWEQFTDPSAVGTCIDTPKFFLINGICAMLIDVLILCVPLPTIYKLNMPPAKKAMVSGILLLGSFVCVASIIRIIALDRFLDDTDVVWAMAEVFVWSCCEPFIGIVCACLPTYGPLFTRFKWFIQMSNKASLPASGKASDSPGVLMTIGGSRAPGLSVSGTTKSNGWSRLARSDDAATKQSGVFRTRPDEDEMELTTNVHGGKSHHGGPYGVHTDASARSTTQNSDSDGGVDDPKSLQVTVQTDVRWEVESRK